MPPDLLAPYGAIGKRLYLPVAAARSPAVGLDELELLLTWEVQVFHPVIGLVGFAKTDRLDLAQLLDIAPPQETAWTFAQKGNPSPPPLTQISLPSLTIEEVFTQSQEDIGTKSIEEIMDKDKEDDNSVGDFLEDMGRKGLKGLFNAVKGFNDFLDSSATEEGYQSRHRFQDWLKEKWDSFESRRNKELNRLMELFDKDPDEALKYALPLDSPYLND